MLFLGGMPQPWGFAPPELTFRKSTTTSGRKVACALYSPYNKVAKKCEVGFGHANQSIALQVSLYK
jgi:hypothetical protein